MSLQPTQPLLDLNSKSLHPTQANTAGNSSASAYTIYDIVGCKQLICWESYFVHSGPGPFPEPQKASESFPVPIHFKSILKQTVILNK